MRPLLLASSLSFILAAAAAADPDVAAETATPPAAAATPPAAATASPASEEQKKLQPPSAEPKADVKAKAKMSAAEMRKISDTYFKQCMQDWDAATHMTRKEWQRTCRRVVDNRAKFMLEQMDK